VHPVLARLGGFELHTYVVFLALGGLAWLRFLGRSFPALFPAAGRAEFWLLANAVALSGYVGGRLFGMAIGAGGTDEGLPTYGVLGGLVAGTLLWARFRRLDPLRLLDSVLVPAPIAHAMARLGCLAAGCCYGRPAFSLPWAVRFHDPSSCVPAVLLGIPLQPTQLYEAVGDILIALALMVVFLPRVADGRFRGGSAALAYLVLYGALRFLTDYARGDEGVIPGLGLVLSQVLSLVVVAASALLELRWRLARADTLGR
jgi:phosphatidylglycerol---prolipoprotein diacylglyceryl transferase